MEARKLLDEFLDGLFIDILDHKDVVGGNLLAQVLGHSITCLVVREVHVMALLIYHTHLPQAYESPRRLW